MEFELTTVSDVSVPAMLPLKEELEKISREYFLSRAATELVMFRIYRIKTTEAWKEGYESYREFCDDMTAKFGISKMTMHTRTTTYQTLIWCGYTEEDAIRLMVEKPYMYTQVVDNMVRRNRDGVPELVINVDKDDDPKIVAKQIIGNVADMKTNEAVQYVRESFTAEPVIRAWISGGVLMIDYTTYAPGLDGEVGIDLQGTVSFHPSDDVPQIVLDRLTLIAARLN